MNRSNPHQVIETIRQKRLRWVEANRENEFEKGIERLLSELYPDQAHFVFELLQNAEDAEASEIHFSLEANRLVVTHDGKRLFDEKDVASITSIGESTKRDNLNKVGKFGVGFKAVFTYTSTPQIFSGDYTFSIHHLVVPEWIPAKIDRPDETRFEFPFNRSDKKAEQCFREIADWLNRMDRSVLLFLRNIKTISWDITQLGKGRLMRTPVRENEIMEIQHFATGKVEPKKSFFLRFEQGVPDKPPLFVAIAFELKAVEPRTISKTPVDTPLVNPVQSNPFNIVATQGRLSIFFPAEKETTRLKFHIHGPFGSTVARDSVPTNLKENQELLSLIARLAAESLIKIRDLGLLTTDFLGVLPNPEDDLSPFYKPILDRISKALKTKPLVPVDGGSFASAANLLKGSADFRKVITNDLLPFFTDTKSLKWVAGVLKNSRADQLLQALQIPEWSPASLLEVLSKKLGVENRPEVFQTFLERRDDKWIQQFYVLLGKTFATENLGLPSNPIHSEGNVAKQAAKWSIVRTWDGHHLVGSQVFKYRVNQPQEEGLPAFRHELLSGLSGDQKKNLEQFLQLVSVQEVDEQARIKFILNEYYGSLVFAVKDTICCGREKKENRRE